MVLAFHGIRRTWAELAVESRLVAYLTAVTEAYDEEGWDSMWASR